MGVVVLLGPPGSGKGTAAATLARDPGMVHLSTGDVLRDAIRAGSERGRVILPYMESGRLVPDDVVTEIVEECLEQGPPHTLYLLDGFPRTVSQAELLEDYLERAGRRLEHVFLLEVSEQDLVTRLLGRFSCPVCRAIYHLQRIPPRVPGICDVCGVPLKQREDDVDETIRERLHVYRRQTQPLVEHYEPLGVLRRVDASGEVGDTVVAMRRVLETFR